MDNTSESASTHPWLWVIEALAGFEEMDNSTLQELIDVAPVVPNNLGKNTRELVARRCLDDLIGSAGGMNASCCQDLKVGLDFSLSFEDVLHQILDEIPLSNLEIAGADLLKWDVRPFIVHKRASSIKLQLEQLKESVIGGTHPCTERLKERSGLTLQNQDYQVPANDGKHKDLLEKDNEQCTIAENMGAKENSSPKEHLLGKNISPSKRNMDYSNDEHVMQYLHEKQVGVEECDSFLRNGKKRKFYEPSNIVSKKDKRVHPHGRDLSENLTERFPLIFKREGRCTESDHMANLREDNEHCIELATMPQHTSGDGPCQNTFLSEAKDDNERCIEPIPANIDDANKVQHKNNKSQSEQEIDFQLKEPNLAYPNGSQQPVSSDEVVVGAVNGCGAEHNEMIDFAAEKHEFSSSYIFSENSKWREQNFCMKCNEGGPLLVCKTTTCRLKVHESCLGKSAQFDAEGNFFCPFCAYSCAVSEYIEAKKTATVARKELCIFLGKGIEHQAIELLEVYRKENNYSPKHKCEHSHAKGNGNDQLPGTRREDRPEHVSNGNSLLFERSQQQAEPPTSCDNIPPSCIEKRIVNNSIDKVLIGEEEMGGMMNPKHSSVEGNEEIQVPADHVGVGDKFFLQKANVLSVKQNTAGGEIQQEMLEQYMTNRREEPVCAHDNGEENIANVDCEKPINSRYSMRSRKCEPQYKSQAIHLLGRRKIPWTAEEEEMLTEGVRKFGVSDGKVPWKQILEFGSHVFRKERKPVDLKDKWKNICKASTKLKR